MKRYNSRPNQPWIVTASSHLKLPPAMGWMPTGTITLSDGGRAAGRTAP